MNVPPNAMMGGVGPYGVRPGMYPNEAMLLDNIDPLERNWSNPAWPPAQVVR